MSRTPAFASIACAIGRAGVASRALAAMTPAATMTMRSLRVAVTAARSPGPGRS